MHVANPDHLVPVWWPPVLSCIFSSLCFPIPSPLFPIFAPVSHPSASWTMPGEQIWWPPLFSLWRRSLIASPPPSPQLDNNGAQNDGKFRPQPPPRAATCNIHILTSGSPTKLPSWIKRVWWLWEAIKSYEGGDFESQEQWLVQSGNLKLSKSGWWPNSKHKMKRISLKHEIYSRHCVGCSNRKAHKFTACKFSSFTTVDFGPSLFSALYLLPNPTTCLCQVFVCVPELYLLSRYWMRFVLWLPSPHLDVLVSHKEGWGDRSTC